MRFRSLARIRVAALVTSLLTVAGLAVATPAANAAVTTSITVDGTASGRTFDGVGAISGGGGNSRLLADYPSTQRSQILDYLFKPNYGADSQILKVEIGGDANSTDGAEPSIEHTQGTVNCNGGYEWWLMGQAKARNPNIRFAALSWAAPSWVGSTTFFTPNAITYLLDWLGCAKGHGFTISYLGGWNERGYDKTWYENLRSALNSHGYSSIKIVASDNTGWKVADDIVADPAFAKAVDIIGVHYPCGYEKTTSGDTCSTSSNATSSGKTLWASENGSQDLNNGAAPLVRSVIRGYLDSKMTAYLNWPIIAALYPNLPFHTTGLMEANQPWSGNYSVGTSLWATAHFTQFTAPGWRFLDSGSGYLGGNRANGSYVSLRSTNGVDYSNIIETTEATATQTATFHVKGGLSTGAVHVWSSDFASSSQSNYFLHNQDITPSNGTYTLTLKPGYVYSITTTTGQSKGSAKGPASSGLALPYSDNFDADATGTEAKYLSDMQGAYEVQPCTNGRTGQCVRQMAPSKPLEWQGDSDPFALLGDTNWTNYTESADVNLQQTGTAELFGRANTQSRPQSHQNAYLFRVSDTGAWSIVKSTTSATLTTLTSGTTSALGTGKWHHLSVTFNGSAISASIDGKKVGSTSDTSFTAGQVGLGVVGYRTDEFDNLSITPIAATGPTGPITSGIAGKCVDDTANATADGTKIELWTCNGGGNQAFTVSSDGSLQVNGKCMDVTGQRTTDGTAVELWTCNGGANQKWTASGGHVIGTQSGKCLDAPTTSNGVQLDIRTCASTPNQSWTLP